MTDQNDLVYITIAIEPVEVKEMYLKQTVLSLTDKETGEEMAAVDTTAGLGGDMILLEWKGRRGKLRMSYVLRQWVKSFDTPGARRLPVTGPPEPSNGEPVPPPAPKGNLGAELQRAMDEHEKEDPSVPPES